MRELGASTLDARLKKLDFSIRDPAESSAWAIALQAKASQRSELPKRLLTACLATSAGHAAAPGCEFLASALINLLASRPGRLPSMASAAKAEAASQNRPVPYKKTRISEIRTPRGGGWGGEGR